MADASNAPFEWEMTPQRDSVTIRLGPVDMKLTTDQLQGIALYMLELRSKMNPPLPTRPGENVRPLPASDLYVSQYRGRLPTDAGCNILVRSPTLGFLNFPASAAACKQIVNDLTTVLVAK